MKLVKYPARAIILKLFCDCEKGELIFQKFTPEGHVHKCTNSDCGKEVTLENRFPTTGAELVTVDVENVETNKDEELVKSE